MLDCIIIGSGPAGLSAAINLKTYNMSFEWFGASMLSDKLNKAEMIVNYPGFPEITGTELTKRFLEHMEHAGLSICEKTVTAVMDAGDYYMVLAENDVYEAKTVILAVGVMTAKVIKGETEFLGRGVSYCATCDGGLYRGKNIAVICNTPRYEHEVKYLSELAGSVTFFPAYVTDIHKDNITVLKDMPIEITGDKKVSSLILRSGSELKVDGVFCLRNAIAPVSLVPGLNVEGGHITVDRSMATNLKGVFACGDCVGRPYQYTKAVGEGNIAAHSVIEYIKNKKC